MQGIQRFGNYFLLKKIATGGMAELYKAKKSGAEGFEKLLAIKLILPHLSGNEEFISMFIDEAKVAALLNHQNIVQIYDLGRIENSYCIVMEYVRGKDLRTVLHRGMKTKSPLPVEHACLVTAQALEGLSYAHRKKDKGKDLGIVHRDISPQNILISYEGEVKIVDFGIAKAATQSRDTRVGVLKGKISYMSPEQAHGRPLDMRSDIFSTGVAFYEMLTGKKLFQGDTDLNTLEKVREAKVEPLPTELNGAVPKELEEILLKSLAKGPEQRFQTASEMEEALLSFMRKAGYSSSASSLSQYMCGLFRQEIEDEAREEEGWDETIVSTQPGLAIPAASTVPAGTAPAPEKPKAPPKRQAPAPALKARGTSGTPGWQKALVAILIVSAGAGLWLKFRQADSTQAQPAPAAAPQQAVPLPAPAQAKAAPAPAAPPAPPPSPAPIKAVSAPAPKAPEKARASISSDPAGADVFIDGVKAGSTPLSLDSIAPGSHQIKVSEDGYDAWTGSLEAQPGKTATVNASLTQQFGSFSIESRPWFFVLIDGDNKGTTPLAGIKLAAGDHNLTLANPRLKIRKQVTLHIESNKTTSIIINPKADPPIKEIVR